MMRSRWIEWDEAAVGAGTSEGQQGEVEGSCRTGVRFLFAKA